MTTHETKSTKTARRTHATQEATMSIPAEKSAEAIGSTTVSTRTAAPEVAAGTTHTATSVPVQLQALEQSCGYADALADDVRAVSERLIQRVPASIVAHVLALAVRGQGTVAGITFDPDAAKAALAAADEADAVATAAQILARRATDHSVRMRASVSGTVSAIRTSLRGYVKTAQGAPLAQANDELRALAKQHTAARKARKTRAENVAMGAPSPAAAKAIANAVAKAAATAKAATKAAKAAAAASQEAPAPAPKAS